MAVVRIDTDRLDDVKAAVKAGLNRHNDSFLPSPRDPTPMAISIRDEAGRVVGGLIGEFRLDWLYVDWLWVDEALRGSGYGKHLMERAEAEARAAGLTHIYLWTWSFQAPDFYTALGYTECGRIKDHPRGHDTIQFVKWLG